MASDNDLRELFFPLAGLKNGTLWWNTFREGYIFEKFKGEVSLSGKIIVLE